MVRPHDEDNDPSGGLVTFLLFTVQNPHAPEEEEWQNHLAEALSFH